MPPLRIILHTAGLVLTLLAFTADAQPAADAPALATARQLLDWLGVNSLIDLTPRIMEQALQGEAQFHAATPAQQGEWRRALAPQINATTLRERIARQIARQIDLQTLQQASTQLQMPLPRRARYFDLAMTQPGAGSALQAFRTELEVTPVTPARRELIRAIVDASGDAKLLAQWQTAVSARAHLTSGAPSLSPRLLEDMTDERTRYLEPRAEVYALYAYRYLTDAELGTYRDQLNGAATQRVIETCRQNLAQAFTE